MALRLKSLMIAVLFLFLSPALCAQGSENPLPPDIKNSAEKEAAKIKKEQEAARVKKIFDDIHERNRTVKKSPEWLKEAYSGLRIKRLNDIPKDEYKSYSQYVRNREAYIIVHPGYYAFFDSLAILLPDRKPDNLPSENIFDRLYSVISTDIFNIRVMKEQERLLRDFLELLSVEKRLVIIILPKDYKKTGRYVWPGIDEYARYINDATNMSESFIYMESKAFDSGYMEKDDMEILAGFFKELDVKKINLSGGYIGRCLDNFYTSLFDKFATIDSYNEPESVSSDKVRSGNIIFFIPDVASIAPDEIDAARHGYLLLPDGKINFKGVEKFFIGRGAERVIFPRIRHFSTYYFYR